MVYNEELNKGLNIVNGKIVYEGVAKAFDLPLAATPSDEIKMQQNFLKENIAIEERDMM